MVYAAGHERTSSFDKMADVKDGGAKDAVVKMEISRGLDPELTLPLDELREYKIYNSTGDGYWFGDMHKNKKTIFIFIRVSGAVLSRRIVYKSHSNGDRNET